MTTSLRSPGDFDIIIDINTKISLGCGTASDCDTGSMLFSELGPELIGEFRLKRNPIDPLGFFGQGDPEDFGLRCKNVWAYFGDYDGGVSLPIVVASTFAADNCGGDPSSSIECRPFMFCWPLNYDLSNWTTNGWWTCQLSPPLTANPRFCGKWSVLISVANKDGGPTGGNLLYGEVDSVNGLPSGVVVEPNGVNDALGEAAVASGSIRDSERRLLRQAVRGGVWGSGSVTVSTASSLCL